jgi:hypothetical protein
VNGQSKESLERIRTFIRNLGDVVNKVRLFDSEICTEGHPSAPKTIAVLVEFGLKMEATLSNIRGLLGGTTSEPFQFQVPVLTPAAHPGATITPERAVVEKVTPFSQRPGKERAAESERLATPPETRQTQDRVETRSNLGSGPSSRRLSTRFKARGITPEPSSESSSELEEEMDIMDIVESSEEPDSDEAKEVMAKAATPPPNRPRIVT